MRERGIVVAVLLLLLCPGASGQRAGETIEVSIVNVDVHVTDKRGHRVTGLRAEDFEVHDDGRLQPITNFTEYAPAASAGTASVEGPAAQTQAPAPQRARRTVVLFIEPVTLPHFRAKQFFDSIRGLLHGTVARGDQVSIVTFTVAMRLRQPFTDDMTVIDAELAKLEREMSGADGTVFEESRAMLAMAARAEEEFEQALAAAGFGVSAIDTPSMSALNLARRQRFLIRQKTMALESLIQSISGADGRKIVIMAMRRFGLLAGLEYFGSAIPQPYRQEFDTAAYRDSLIRTANAHGVTLYPVHTQGLTPGGDDPALESHLLLNETSALHEVAQATGGLTAWGPSDIAKMLPRVTEDLDAYYSIGYRTPATRKDATRKIVVKAKNPDYVVRARRQFVEKSDVTQMKDRVVANLYQKVDGSSAPIPFDVALGEVKKNGRNRWTVPLKVKVPIRALTTLPRGDEQAGEFSVYLATGSVLGVMSEVDRKVQTFQFPRSQLERAQTSHFTYELELSVDKLANRLSIAVMDEVGKEFNLKRYTLPERQ